MQIPELNAIQMNRTNPAHYGKSKIVPLTRTVTEGPIGAVQSVNRDTEAAGLQRAGNTGGVEGKSFQDFLLEAVNNVNTQQNDVSRLEQKLITNPDEVDIQDVTIAMSKARMSLNLAQTVIDRLVTDWNEITTTR